MPDLGKYAFAVLSAYGASLGLLAGIVALTLWRGTRVRRALREMEARTAPVPEPRPEPERVAADG